VFTQLKFIEPMKTNLFFCIVLIRPYQKNSVIPSHWYWSGCHFLFI